MSQELTLRGLAEHLLGFVRQMPGSAGYLELYLEEGLEQDKPAESPIEKENAQLRAQLVASRQQRDHWQALAASPFTGPIRDLRERIADAAREHGAACGEAGQALNGPEWQRMRNELRQLAHRTEQAETELAALKSAPPLSRSDIGQALNAMLDDRAGVKLVDETAEDIAEHLARLVLGRGARLEEQCIPSQSSYTSPESRQDLDSPSPSKMRSDGSSSAAASSPPTPALLEAADEMAEALMSEARNVVDGEPPEYCWCSKAVHPEEPFEQHERHCRGAKHALSRYRAERGRGAGGIPAPALPYGLIHAAIGSIRETRALMTGWARTPTTKADADRDEQFYNLLGGLEARLAALFPVTDGKAPEEGAKRG